MDYINYTLLESDVCRPGKTIYESDRNLLFDCLKCEGEEGILRLRATLRGGANWNEDYHGYTFIGAACCIGRCDIIKAFIEHIKLIRCSRRYLKTLWQTGEIAPAALHDHFLPLPQCFQSFPTWSLRFYYVEVWTFYPGLSIKLSSAAEYFENNDDRSSEVSKRRKASLGLDTYDINGYTPLLYAICGGHFDICQLLITEGADTDLPHQMSKQTPLLMAIEHSKDEIVAFLLENNADVQISDNVGITPLYSAIKCRNESVVKQLIEADCDVNVGSQDHAPLFLATRTGQLNIVKMLCEAGCYKDIRNKYGVTPVYEAALKGHEHVLEYLLEAECSPNMVDMYDQSPLHVAVLSNQPNCVKLLLEAGSNWKLRNHNRESAFDLALQLGRSCIVQHFLEEGLDVLPKSATPTGLKNIVAVFEGGHTDTLSVLLKGCAKLPILHCIGVLPMFRNQTHLMKLLLHSGIQTVPAQLLAVDTHQCKETSDWLKDFHSNPRSLQDMCRIRVRRTLGNKVLYGVKHLPLPTDLKAFISLNKL